MSYGYTGKILRVDLTTETITVDEHPDVFYRRYMGGGNIGAYYLLKELEKGIDPLSPENIIVFAIAPITGAPVAGFSRHSIVSKSPLTGLIGDTEAGGFFGPELKFAGYDAVVVKGKASRPVYLWIKDDEVQIKEAGHLWGKNTKETQELIREELDDRKVIISLIGPAGENLVRYASVSNNLKHYNGRTGMGAVMGSKNLKAIAVRGSKKMKIKDRETMKELNRSFGREFLDNAGMKILHERGTAAYIALQNVDGQLPTKNFQTGYLEGAEEFSADRIHETIFHSAEGCYACPVKCKMVVGANEPYDIDPDYGGPEYEGLSALGSYTCMQDTHVVAKANELCNRYGLDVISMGAVTSFAMECFEKGLITEEETDGLSLDFGSGEALLTLIERVAFRRDIGDLLAEGVKRAASKLGGEAPSLAMHTKGYEFPAHDPRAKHSLGLAYAVVPIGADHVAGFGDPGLSPKLMESTPEVLRFFGFYDTLDPDFLGEEKAKLYYYGQMINSYKDVLDICTFTSAPGGYWHPQQILDLVRAITGWEVSQWELMKLGERRINMFRVFNAREGAGVADDVLPDRMFEPLTSGPREGQKLDREEFLEAKKSFYEMSGWNENGCPTRGKLVELGIGWVADVLESTSG